MKILYLSDDYAKDVCGTKTSIFKEMKNRDYNIVYDTIHSAGKNTIDGKKLIDKLKKEKFTDLWISHTWVIYKGCTLREINDLGVKVLGFGFSDPYAWKAAKLNQYNTYSTNCLSTYHSVKKIVPCVYFPTACDLSFHKRHAASTKTTDILIFGVGKHSRFKPREYRIKIVQQLMKDFPGKKIKIFGRNWGPIKTLGHLGGVQFIDEINHAKISVDLQQEHAPLAHRMFESMACGTYTITCKRPEVDTILPGDLIGKYVSYVDLKNKIQILLNTDSAREESAKLMYENTIKNHSMINRIDNLLKAING